MCAYNEESAYPDWHYPQMALFANFFVPLTI